MLALSAELSEWARTRELLAHLSRQHVWEGGERLIRLGLFAAAAFAVGATALIALSLVFDTVEFFTHVSPFAFFSGTVWSPDIRGQYGVMPLLVGTLIIAGGACAIGFPLGLSAAIYLREYAPSTVRNTVKPVLEVLAGIPTVVFGFFALLVVSPVLQAWFGADFFNGMNAIIVIGIMIIPLVSSMSEDALASVPRDLRDGALALGATRLEVVGRVTIPAAFSGITASFLLAFSRAVGETMVVLIAAGLLTDLNFDPLRPMSTLAGYIAKRATGDLPVGSVLFQSLFAVGFTLFMITLALNVLSAKLRSRFREVYD